ncbi:hypothetical protein JXA12_01025 [Candidatus Woesearchaeota archaeon]|nr:hypothetical protein [Candidatus Woesearchaeota archaeon]
MGYLNIFLFFISVNDEIAECVGLWLAEGDSTSRYELTFTNNSPALIRHFYSGVSGLFPGERYHLYIYGLGNPVKPPIPGIAVRTYTDKRARKPYFIIRLASKATMTAWYDIVSDYLSSDDISVVASIIRGFFAGEGSVKVSSHNSRILRIAQKERTDYLDNTFSLLGLHFRFFAGNRTYEFSGRDNWLVFAEHRLADLHPLKKASFWSAYHDFKQCHYPKLYLKQSIFPLLSEPKSARQLAKAFSRSSARIYDVLSELKEEGSVSNYRVGSVDYWVASDCLVISGKKKAYLDCLSIPRVASYCARLFDVTHKSATRRLRELEKLGLAQRLPNKQWKAINTEKKLCVI